MNIDVEGDGFSVYSLRGSASGAGKSSRNKGDRFPGALSAYIAGQGPTDGGKYDSVGVDILRLHSWTRCAVLRATLILDVASGMPFRSQQTLRARVLCPDPIFPDLHVERTLPDDHTVPREYWQPCTEVQPCAALYSSCSVPLIRDRARTIAKVLQQALQCHTRCSDEALFAALIELLPFSVHILSHEHWPAQLAAGRGSGRKKTRRHSEARNWPTVYGAPHPARHSRPSGR